MTNANTSGVAASVEVVQRCYGHAARGEWEQANALLADDFAFHEPRSLDYGGVWRGKDAMQRLVGTLMNYWGDPDIKVVHLLGDDRHCIVLMKLSVTSKKTGRRFTQDVVEVLHVSDGRISELRVHYFDTAELALDTGSIERLNKPEERV
jgi:ketosteroid isomerase-like protein